MHARCLTVDPYVKHAKPRHPCGRIRPVSSRKLCGRGSWPAIDARSALRHDAALRSTASTSEPPLPVERTGRRGIAHRRTRCRGPSEDVVCFASARGVALRCELDVNSGDRMVYDARAASSRAAAMFTSRWRRFRPRDRARSRASAARSGRVREARFSVATSAQLTLSSVVPCCPARTRRKRAAEIDALRSRRRSARSSRSPSSPCRGLRHRHTRAADSSSVASIDASAPASHARPCARSTPMRACWS